MKLREGEGGEREGGRGKEGRREGGREGGRGRGREREGGRERMSVSYDSSFAQT